MALLALSALLSAVFLVPWGEIPDAWLPWKPLEIDAPPNFLTRYKLSRLSGQPELCDRVLATTGFVYQRLTDRETGPGCGFHDAVRIDQTSASVGEPFSLTCRAAVSLALWERHILQPAARQHLGSEVARLQHYGSYSCRNVYNRPSATRSRHATAEAFDLAGVTLSDGRHVRVQQGWTGESAEGSFLRSIRDGACEFFDGVLSPDYNTAHRDHLHLDRGPYRVCR